MRLRRRPTVTTVPMDMLKDRLARINRTHVYKPARMWVTWLFLASLVSMIADVFAGWHAFQLGGLNGLVDASWYMVPIGLSAGFGISKTTVDVLIASGFFLHEGDLGFVNLDSLEMRHPVLAQSTFVVNTEERMRYYPPEVHYQKVTRYEVWRWGRRGGVWKWPFWDGGKRDGYWAVIQHSWDVAEIEEKPGSDKKILWGRGTPLATYTEVTEGGRTRTFLQQDMAEQLRKTVPGILRGRVLDIRYVIWPSRSPLELPEELAMAIMSDSEYRVSSLVNVGYDQLPEEVYLGTVAPPNALARLWGMETAHKQLTDEYVALQKRFAQSRILHEIAQGGVTMQDVERIRTGQLPEQRQP